MRRSNGGGRRVTLFALALVAMLLLGGGQFYILKTVTRSTPRSSATSERKVTVIKSEEHWSEVGNEDSETENPPPPQPKKRGKKERPKPTTATPPTKRDLQLFIIWNGAMKYANKIISNIQESDNFEIYKKITWVHNKDTYREDLWRLYWGKGGLQKKGMTKKVQQCGGAGKAIVLLVEDKNPVYGNVETAHGTDYVNKNMHTAKYKYRKMSGGGFKVHGTYNMAETEHDSFVLFGHTATELYQNPAAIDTLNGTSYGFYQWPSCESLYTSLTLITTIDKISPPLSSCQDHTKGTFSLSAAIPDEYDQTLDIKASMISMVHGTDDEEGGWLTTVSGEDSKFKVRFVIEE
eukprot:TRINITY_DN31756_c0_g1_i1.p1 TRINITY_DN31756_c0_g1~~TRINITY_DN31756_c0_g1_i1.p1  ORF type:complete len:349 (+),score=50.11 TRINITY_DN31756_c0_g1_i1:153-1199(+)